MFAAKMFNRPAAARIVLTGGRGLSSAVRTDRFAAQHLPKGIAFGRGRFMRHTKAVRAFAAGAPHGGALQNLMVTDAAEAKKACCIHSDGN